MEGAVEGFILRLLLFSAGFGGLESPASLAVDCEGGKASDGEGAKP